MPKTEKWERTKRYLFRNLLADPGSRFSPIIEESLSDNLVDGPPARSSSPLPDLIIEPEPNRHDEPPEFYKGLELRMRRLYKELFAKDRLSSVETEDLINVGEGIHGLDVNQRTLNTFSHHREVYRTTSEDSEILNPNSILKEMQNVPKIVETKDPSEMENENSTILNKSKKRALSVENISKETELTELDMDFTQVISTRGNESEEIKEMENKNKSSMTEGDRSILEFGNPSTSGTKPLSVDEKKDPETELTDSDEYDTHVISTTVAKIHEEPVSGKKVVIETKSPVLIPTTRRKVRKVNFSAVTKNTGNIVENAKNKNKAEDVNQTDMQNVENIIENNEREAAVDQYDSQLDREIENILQNAEAVSNFDPMYDFYRDSEKSKEVSSNSEELFAFLKESSEVESPSNGPPRKRSRPTEFETLNSFEMALRRGAFERLNKKRTSNQSSEVEINTEEVSRGEERIDSEKCRDTFNDDEYSSFESAIRLEAFQRINRRKGFGQASEESDSASDETEVVEEMRGIRQVESEPLQSFQRKSTSSQESLQDLFAKPIVAESPEDISIGAEELNKSMEGFNRTMEENKGQNSTVRLGFTANTHTVAEFQNDTSTSDEGLMIMSQEDDSLREECVEETKAVCGSGYVTHKHKALHFQADISKGNEENVNVSSPRLQAQNSSKEDSVVQRSAVKRQEMEDSSVHTEEATPSAPGSDVMTNFCDEIWSVSPISIDTADFADATSSKRRKIAKRDASVQTATPAFWKDIKSDFFVGEQLFIKHS